MSAPTPPADGVVERLRELGYHLDADDVWVHGRLGLEVDDVEGLLALPAPVLRAVHDPDAWTATPPDAPAVEGELLRVLRSGGLRWCGWHLAWVAGDGSALSVDGAARLGPDGVRRLLEGRAAFWQDRARRVRGLVAGGLSMVAWLFVGWLAGSTGWVVGMGLIAAITLWFRPRRLPPELAMDHVPFNADMDATIERLGEAWRAPVEDLGLVLRGDALYLYPLDRAVRWSAWEGAVGPGELVRLFQVVVPWLPPEP